MRRKLLGYSVLSFFSFCLFTVIFYTLASAETLPNRAFQAAKPKVATPIPAPTSAPSPTPAIIPSGTPTPSPNSKPKVTSAAPTLTSAPTSTPTITPTNTPTPQSASTPIPPSTPTFPPLPTLASAPDLESLFQKYSDEYAVAKDLLKRIASCESGFNSEADTGLYAGMFQFSSQTWINNRNAMGLDPNPDLRKNAEESIRTAAFMIARGQQNAWKNCL